MTQFTALPVLLEVQRSEFLKEATYLTLALDGSTSSRNVKLMAISVINEVGDSILVSFIQTRASTGEAIVKAIKEDLRALGLVEILSEKIAFIISDGCYTQLKVNRLLIEFFKSDENPDQNIQTVTCSLHHGGKQKYKFQMIIKRLKL